MTAKRMEQVEREGLAECPSLPLLQVFPLDPISPPNKQRHMCPPSGPVSHNSPSSYPQGFDSHGSNLSSQLAPWNPIGQLQVYSVNEPSIELHVAPFLHGILIHGLDWHSWTFSIATTNESGRPNFFVTWWRIILKCLTQPIKPLRVPILSKTLSESIRLFIWLVITIH